MHTNNLKVSDECEVQIESSNSGLNLMIFTGHSATSAYYFDHASARAVAERIINALDNYQLQQTKE